MPEARDAVGPYQIVGPLGAGGMGEVYRAVDTRMGRQVALKILPESLAQDEDRRRRFEQEARLTASLNHPNIMAIYDVGLDQHPPYIVSELIAGESLRALINKSPIAPRKAVGIAAQVADALAAAHAAAIVHRDLKPENIMVTPEGTAKILDFGVARMRSPAGPPSGDTMTMAQTVAGSVIGTAAYMSPEQARAEDVDHRSDQFSFGLVLYEMLAGKAAFERPSAVQIMSAIVEDDPPAIDRPIPAQLRWILDRCLAKARADRYESTRDLARDLAQLRDHFAEMTTAVTGVGPAVPAARPKRTAVAIAAAAVAGAVLAWCAVALLSKPNAVDLARYRLTPFATTLVRHILPSWSPDGKSIAFIGLAESGPLGLYVQGLDAATPVRINGPDVNVFTGSPPVWAPDSQSIYFRCGLGSESAGLCRVPAGGGSSILVQPDVQSATISPDGRTLAIWPTGRNPKEVRLWIASPPDAPRKPYDPMPFEATQFYNNPLIAFSPDGRQLLLSVAIGGRGETSWLLPWPAGKGRAIFEAERDFSFTPQFSWMPDSRHILFAETTLTRSRQIYMEDTVADRYWPVLTQERPPGGPTVSPDGTRVAYSSDLSQADIVSVPLQDGPVKTLVGSSRNEQRVDASRVSPQVVFVTDRRGVDEVWLKSLSEGWERPVLTPASVQVDGANARDFLSPVFSPDGQRIAVGIEGRHGIYLYTVFTSGGSPVRVTSAPGALELCATWSPDGNWLAYLGLVKSEPHLLKVRPGSGEPPVDLGPYYDSAVPVWSPTGDWIASHNHERRLVLVSPDGKTVRELPGDWGPATWSHDGKTLYQIRGNSPALMAIDIAHATVRMIRDLPDMQPFSIGNPGLSAALTSDQKSIVYTINRPRNEIWILDGLQTPAPWYRRVSGAGW